MSTRDSTFSYVHIVDPNQVLYMERWRDDPIPFDDIDTQTLIEATTSLFPQLLLEEEEDGAIPINSTTLGAKVYKNRKLLKDKVWSDLGIFEKFLNETSSLNKQVDQTILKPVHSKHEQGTYQFLEESHDLEIGDFLSNGYSANDNLHNILSPGNDSMMAYHGDISLNSTSDMLGPSNNTFSNYRSNSMTNQTGQGPIQTPRHARTRQFSNDKNFQTPITRIMR